jgi:hypothetical protein
MSAARWIPAADQVTTPDQLDEEAFLALDLMDDERIRNVWRTRQGFLLLTNLRVVSLWRHSHLFGTREEEWKEGPAFLLYNLTDPRVLAERYVELTEREGPNAGFARFAVQDPERVCAAVAGAIPAGDIAWRARRQQVQAHLDALRERERQMAQLGMTGNLVREVARIPCRYCGNLVLQGAAHCPNCGAPTR